MAVVTHRVNCAEAETQTRLDLPAALGSNRRFSREWLFEHARAAGMDRLRRSASPGRRDVTAGAKPGRTSFVLHRARHEPRPSPNVDSTGVENAPVGQTADVLGLVLMKAQIIQKHIQQRV
jgi:hypothetical protein